jgi:hypothetical protein
MNTPHEFSQQIRDLYLQNVKDGAKDKRLKAHEYFLKHGKEFTGFADIEKDPKLVKCGYRKPKNCFKNAQMCAIMDESADYYEGQAVCHTERSGALIPMDHAWLVKNGKVYDPTWQKMCTTADYFGMKIPTEFVQEKIVQTDTADAWIWYFIIDEKI